MEETRTANRISHGRTTKSCQWLKRNKEPIELARIRPVTTAFPFVPAAPLNKIMIGLVETANARKKYRSKI
jgi:hypothetical protein